MIIGHLLCTYVLNINVIIINYVFIFIVAKLIIIFVNFVSPVMKDVDTYLIINYVKQYKKHPVKIMKYSIKI